MHPYHSKHVPINRPSCVTQAGFDPSVIDKDAFKKWGKGPHRGPNLFANVFPNYPDPSRVGQK